MQRVLRSHLHYAVSPLRPCPQGYDFCVRTRKPCTFGPTVQKDLEFSVPANALGFMRTTDTQIMMSSPHIQFCSRNSTTYRPEICTTAFLQLDVLWVPSGAPPAEGGQGAAGDRHHDPEQAGAPDDPRGHGREAGGRRVPLRPLQGER